MASASIHIKKDKIDKKDKKDKTDKKTKTDKKANTDKTDIQDDISTRILNNSSFVGRFLNNNTTQDTAHAITIINNLRKSNFDNIHIIKIIENVLPVANYEFLIFINTINNNIINNVKNLDNILHHLPSDDIIALLENKILNIQITAENMAMTPEQIMFIIIQFSNYNDTIIKYLFNISFNNKFNNNSNDSNDSNDKPGQNVNGKQSNKRLKTTKTTNTTYIELVKLKYKNNSLPYKLLEHMLYYNVCNDIFVYVKACIDNNMLSSEVLNFNKILESFTIMNDKQKDKPQTINIRLRSRLIGVIKLLSELCYNYSLEMPLYKDYTTNFKTFYKIYKVDNETINKTILDLLDSICLDSYIYINDSVPWGAQKDIRYIYL